MSDSALRRLAWTCFVAVSLLSASGFVFWFGS